MNRPNRSKLNQLLQIWPQGTVFTQAALTKAGISKQLAATYQKSSWLKRIGHGAFMRDSDEIDWLGGIYAIQHQLNLPIHPSGKTALQLQGYSHFSPLGKNYPVWLMGNTNNKLPGWFKTYKWNVDIRYHTTTLFSSAKQPGLTEYRKNSYAIKISTPERAILEVLYFIPNDQSFTEAQLLMEGLTTLRPQVVQELLANCNSIKVKRLFLFLAESCNHPWLKKIDLAKVNLGHGKRMLTKKGRWNSKYQITIPNQ